MDLCPFLSRIKAYKLNTIVLAIKMHNTNKVVFIRNIKLCTIPTELKSNDAMPGTLVHRELLYLQLADIVLRHHIYLESKTERIINYTTTTHKFSLHNSCSK